MRVIEASPSVGLGSAHYILYGRLLWHHTVCVRVCVCVCVCVCVQMRMHIVCFRASDLRGKTSCVDHKLKKSYNYYNYSDSKLHGIPSNNKVWCTCICMYSCTRFMLPSDFYDNFICC